MSEPIKVGDLVQVVRDCCGRYVGEVFVTGRLSSAFSAHCEFCRAEHQGPFWINPHGAVLPGRRPIPWLKRIPDFPELKDERHDEEITA